MLIIYTLIAGLGFGIGIPVLLGGYFLDDLVEEGDILLNIWGLIKTILIISINLAAIVSTIMILSIPFGLDIETFDLLGYLSTSRIRYWIAAIVHGLISAVLTFWWDFTLNVATDFRRDKDKRLTDKQRLKNNIQGLIFWYGLDVISLIICVKYIMLIIN